MITKRRASRQIFLGGIPIGGGAPIPVQTMPVCDTADIETTVNEIYRFADAGCDIVRLACPNREAAAALESIVKRSPIPVVADIHFDYRLALQAADNGVHGLRVNPGNLAEKDYIRAVVKKAKEREIPIRIGVNAGSLEPQVKAKHPNDIGSALVESAMLNVRLLEEEDFFNLKVSVKASDPMTMVSAYRRVADAIPYPLHLGVTEAGTLKRGLIKSSIGIGILLAEGIGDTIRVSLTADSVEEITAGHEILRSLGLREESADLISCPSCGRAELDLHTLANQVEAMIGSIKLPVRVAVMGCFVNGPGEAEQADLGIAGGKHEFYIFEGTEKIKKVPPAQALDAFKTELDRFIANNRAMLEARKQKAATGSEQSTLVQV